MAYNTTAAAKIPKKIVDYLLGLFLFLLSGRERKKDIQRTCVFL
jgi:hypothetical protein